MKRIEVKMPNELHAKFKEYCENQRRSMLGQILWLIEEALHKDEEKGKAEPA